MGAKSKTRGGASGSPRGAATAAWRRAWLVRSAGVVLVLVAALVGYVIWGTTSRADVLRDFDRALFEAHQDYLKHLDAEAETDMLGAHARFLDGELSPNGLRALVESWERDFTTARDRVRALDPNTATGLPPTPHDLIQATWFIAEGIEGMRGVARLYLVAADAREAELSASGSLRETLAAHLAGLLQQIDEARIRAINTHELGVRQVQNALREANLTGHQLRPRRGDQPLAPVPTPG